MRRVEGDGVSIAVRVKGEGHPVLLIHGFPDSGRLWRHQVPALVAAGMRAIVPDLRGLGESDKPPEREAYRVSHSVADMIRVLDELGAERAHVVGHDWGAAVAWRLAAQRPDRVSRLVALSVGHPNAFGDDSFEQRKRFWYQLLFQFEGIAEELVRREDWRFLREWTRGNGDIEHYIADLSRPGALTAGLNWYRANAHPAGELRTRPEMPSVAAPTLGVWSSGDEYLVEDVMRRSAEHVRGGWRYERIEGASHWMQLDEPVRVTRLLLEFLA